MDESTLARVESQLVDLEANITKLKKALRHWQALEIDYQGLSDEFIGCSENVSKEQLLQTARDYEPDIVDEKELRDLLNHDKGVPRRPEQIIGLLSKRIDYVDRNVETIKKQLSDAERKRNALLLVQEPELRGEAGLPLTEITEELDEEGEVVSSKVQRSDEAAPQLTEVLRRAGVGDIGETDGKVIAEHSIGSRTGDTPPLPSSSPKQSVQSSAMGTHLPASNTPAVETSQPVEILPASITTQTEIPEKEAASSQQSVNARGESAEDAALRAEMLRYHDGLGEVGAIVAELDLEDGEVSFGEEEDDLSFGSDYDEDEDLEEESEDERGMSRHAIQSGAYLRKMQQLEKKHGITGMSNLGPEPDRVDEVEAQLDRPPPAEAARTAALARAAVATAFDEDPTRPKQNPAKKTGKRVAFADALDIATENKPVSKKPESSSTKPVVLTARPFKESVVERPVKESVEADEIPATKKVSRFKAARGDIPQTPMLPPGSSDLPSFLDDEDRRPGPVGKIYEPNIIEHQVASGYAAPTPGGGEDGIDEAMHQREIAAEYHQLRNRMIQRQGGFVGEGEQNNWGEETAPLPVEDDAGKVRKVSRFKAARMK